MNFYRFTEQDFEEVPIEEIKPGDKFSWSIGTNSSLYGAVAVDEIMETAYGYALFFDLPIGAGVSSNKNCTVTVSWEGDQPIIRAIFSWWKEEHKTNLILVQRNSSQERS